MSRDIEKGPNMEEEQIYAPEQPEETPNEASEDTGEQEETQDVEVEAEQVEEESEPTTPAIPTESAREKALLKAKQEEVRKRQDVERRLAELESRLTVEAEKSDTTVDPEPQEDDFDDWSKYNKTWNTWNTRQIIKAERNEMRTLTQAEVAKREEAQLLSKAQSDAQKVAQKYADFAEMAGPVESAASPEVKRALYESDMGAELAYYLGKNPAELDRFFSLSRTGQIKEIGKLEIKLATKVANPETKRTKAPTPVETAGNGFKSGPDTLTKARAEAMKTGKWADYFIKAGIAEG